MDKITISRLMLKITKEKMYLFDKVYLVMYGHKVQRHHCKKLVISEYDLLIIDNLDTKDKKISDVYEKSLFFGQLLPLIQIHTNKNIVVFNNYKEFLSIIETITTNIEKLVLHNDTYRCINYLGALNIEGNVSKILKMVNYYLSGVNHKDVFNGKFTMLDNLLITDGASAYVLPEFIRYIIKDMYYRESQFIDSLDTIKQTFLRSDESINNMNNMNKLNKLETIESIDYGLFFKSHHKCIKINPSVFTINYQNCEYSYNKKYIDFIFILYPKNRFDYDNMKFYIKNNTLYYTYKQKTISFIKPLIN